MDDINPNVVPQGHCEALVQPGRRVLPAVLQQDCAKGNGELGGSAGGLKREAREADENSGSICRPHLQRRQGPGTGRGRRTAAAGGRRRRLGPCVRKAAAQTRPCPPKNRADLRGRGVSRRGKGRRGWGGDPGEPMEARTCGAAKKQACEEGRLAEVKTTTTDRGGREGSRIQQGPGGAGPARTQLRDRA